MTFEEMMFERFPQMRDMNDSQIVEFMRNQWGMVCAFIKESSIGTIKIEQMSNTRGTSTVKNQFLIHAPEGTYFQSYDSIIAFKPRHGGKIQLDERYWDYSTTTGKYRNEFLNEGIAETRVKIKNGDYTLSDLNK